MFRSKHIAAWS